MTPAQETSQITREELLERTLFSALQNQVVEVINRCPELSYQASWGDEVAIDLLVLQTLYATDPDLLELQGEAVVGPSEEYSALDPRRVLLEDLRLYVGTCAVMEFGDSEEEDYFDDEDPEE
mgnify:CR=1 FL=1